MTTINTGKAKAAWTPLVIRFVAEHLQGVGQKLDLYLQSRLAEIVPQRLVSQAPAIKRVELLRKLLDADDHHLRRQFRFESWKLFLALADHHRLEGNRDAEEEALRQLQREIAERGAIEVWNDMKLGSSRRQHNALFGKRRGAERRLEAASRAAVWQKQADEIWKRNPSQTASDVAKKIEQTCGTGKWGTIRRHIKKPVGIEPSC